LAVVDSPAIRYQTCSLQLRIGATLPLYQVPPLLSVHLLVALVLPAMTCRLLLPVLHSRTNLSHLAIKKRTAVLQTSTWRILLQNAIPLITESNFLGQFSKILMAFLQAPEPLSVEILLLIPQMYNTIASYFSSIRHRQGLKVSLCVTLLQTNIWDKSLKDSLFRKLHWPMFLPYPLPRHPLFLFPTCNPSSHPIRHTTV